MIIIGVFCMGVRFDSSDSTGPVRRDLMQTYNRPSDSGVYSPEPEVQVSSELQPIHSFHTNMNPTYSTHSEV